MEDHAPTRDSLAAVLSAAPGFRCLSTHVNTQDALAHLPIAHASVVLVDINLPGQSGIECVLKLKQKLPGILCLMWTVEESVENIFEALKAGADGYILKTTPPEEILERIRDTCAGDAPMSRSIARKVVQYFHGLPKPSAKLEQLTPREHEVLSELATGYSNKELSSKLNISEETIRNHLRSIYTKLQVHSRTEAVVKYLRK